MKIATISTLPPDDMEKKQTNELTKSYSKEISKLQRMLYARKKESMLVILQGMDAAGKSSTVRDVFKYVNPMGIHTKSFKKPTEQEFAHDFLWRVHQHVPAKGMISIFDRSHYEEILIQRVHNWVDEEQIKQRIDHINNFERLLVQESNTTILKFYIHISKEEQESELMERKTDEDKLWKHNENDWKEREYWEEYMKAYDAVFEYCSPEIPWVIVPADKSWYKRYVVAKTICETLRKMNLSWPPAEE